MEGRCAAEDFGYQLPFWHELQQGDGAEAAVDRCDESVHAEAEGGGEYQWL